MGDRHRLLPRLALALRRERPLLLRGEALRERRRRVRRGAGLDRAGDRFAKLSTRN